MTTNPALTERIAEAVRQALSDGEALQCTRVWEAWLYKTMTDEDFTDASDGPLVEEVTAAVLPLIAAEVRKAQADALRSAVRDMGDWADEVYVIAGDPLDEDTWTDITTGEWMTARADTIEKEGRP